MLNTGLQEKILLGPTGGSNEHCVRKVYQDLITNLKNQQANFRPLLVRSSSVLDVNYII